MSESRIEHHAGGTSFVGPDAVAAFRAITIASGLRFYAKTGMQPNRAYTPKAMMAAAAEITGKAFKARDYEGAANALSSWAAEKRVQLPETTS